MIVRDPPLLFRTPVVSQKIFNPSASPQSLSARIRHCGPPLRPAPAPACRPRTRPRRSPPQSA